MPQNVFDRVAMGAGNPEFARLRNRTVEDFGEEAVGREMDVFDTLVDDLSRDRRSGATEDRREDEPCAPEGQNWKPTPALKFRVPPPLSGSLNA